MNFYAHTITIAVLLAASLTASAAEPVLQPQQAVLVLRNHQVLEGAVTPVGDYYLVSLGKTGQVRLAAKDVEMICRDLPEAYRRQAAGIDNKSAAAHVDLAQWCLRQAMYEEVRAELAAAREIDPAYRRIGEVQQRLEFATAAAKPAAVKPPPTTATVGAQQLDRTMKQLPSGTVEHYTAVIQPILMDRCGNAKCHGAGSTASFQLLQPVAGKVPSRRFTQRNLFATLAIVNKETAEESQLLTMARKPHGHIEKAAFKSEDDRQYREILEWITSLRPVPKQLPPATVSTIQTGSLQRQVGPAEMKPNIGAEQQGPANQTPKESLPPAIVRDPFDPEIFNRRFHPQR